MTGSADGFIRTWNPLVDSEYLWEATATKQTDQLSGVNPIKTVAISGDGEEFVVGFEDGQVEIWDFSTKEVKVSKPLGSQSIERLAISPDDHWLAVQSGDSLVDVLSMENPSQVVRLLGTLPRGDPFSPDNKMIGIQAGELKLYPVSASVLTPEPGFILYDFPPRGTMSYSPDGKIVTAFSGGVFSYWSTSSGRELKASILENENRCRVLYRRDNSFIAAASENGVIYSNKNLNLFCQASRNARATSEEFLPDGSIIALSLQNQQIEIWDVRKDSPKLDLQLETSGEVLDVAISADGKLLAAASAGGAIELYNLENLEWIRTLNLPTGRVQHVLFSNDSNYLIAGLSDGTLRFFGLQP